MLAGFARLDITPPLGTPITGYYRARYAEGILDPLELNAVAFSDGENTSLIIVADCLGINKDCSAYIRKNIEGELGIPADNVITSVTHSHTTFSLNVLPSAAPNFAPGGIFQEKQSREYLNVINRKFVDVARLAIDDMKEATISVGSAKTKDQVAFIRRYLMKDGTVKAFPSPLPNPDIVRPMSDPDNTLRLIRIDREGDKSIAIANFQTHADTTKGSLLSADWPGHLRRFVEADLPMVNCITVVGAQGDSNHVNPNVAGSQFSPEGSRRIGRVIADAVLDAWDKTSTVNTDKISSEVRTVFNKTRTDGIERLEQAREYVKAYDAKLIPSDTQKRAEMGRITRIPTAPLYQQIPVTVMKLGDVVLVGFGGEPFTEYSNRARAALPDKFTISVMGANGFQGYLPTKQAFYDGGYEAGVSSFSPSLEEEIMNTVFEMLK